MKTKLLCLVAAIALGACGYDRNTKMVPVEPTQSSTANEPNSPSH